VTGDRGAPDEPDDDRDPNPVTQIIRVRTAQVAGPALLALVGLRAALGPAWTLPLAGGGALLMTAALSAYFAATFTASLPIGGPVVTRLPRRKEYARGDAAAAAAVALTFDDGPHPATSPRLLDLLRAHDARATFFVLGERAARYPEIVRRMAREGHALGIHGLRHRTLVLQSAREIERDLREARRLIEAAAGARPVRLLRPPYGFKSVTLARVARSLGLTVVAWSVDPRDYDPIPPDLLLARVRARMRPGSIVLLHERRDAETTLEALPAVLGLCRDRGWRCVSLAPEELI
jgi:peptidoglycan/xylan/chitin deacetylase (PgdA/CDA1 family)